MSAHQLADHRALLHTVRNRLVRAVAAEDTEYAAAVFEVLAQRSRRWDVGDWEAAMTELSTSRLNVGEWLEQEHARK